MRCIEVRDRQKVMPAIGIDDSEMAYRRGYQRGAAKAFLAVERFLDPATREVLRAWIELDVYRWQAKGMPGYAPIWRLSSLKRCPKSKVNLRRRLGSWFHRPP
jgi:hypothetical protein